MKIIKKMMALIVLANIMFLLTGCKKQEDNSELKTKVISELEYVNTKIIDMLNGLNNISFQNYTIMSKQVKLDNSGQKQQSKQGENGSSGSGSEGEKSKSEQKQEKQEDESQDLINTTEMITDNILTKDRNNIDWDIIKPEIELLNETWSIIILDLYSLNVDSSLILDFSSKLDTAMKSIKNEDKQASLIALANLYKNIPEFLEQIDAEKNLQKIRQTQMYVINAYSIADDITNTEINSNLKNAVDVYSQVISDIDYTQKKSFKTNKTYVLLNELANSITNEDSEIFYVKYKNFMESINEL